MPSKTNLQLPALPTLPASLINFLTASRRRCRRSASRHGAEKVLIERALSGETTFP